MQERKQAITKILSLVENPVPLKLPLKLSRVSQFLYSEKNKKKKKNKKKNVTLQSERYTVEFLYV